jgi:hypothetical protein
MRYSFAKLCHIRQAFTKRIYLRLLLDRDITLNKNFNKSEEQTVHNRDGLETTTRISLIVRSSR